MHFTLRLLLLCLTLGPASIAQAQSEIVAIAAPVEGQAVAGRVGIAGAAASPLFERYEIDFGYEPNPTDTWFPIGEPVRAQQTGGLLAEWDTLGLGVADGVYTLRLRVYRVDGTFVEAFARSIELRNGSAAAITPLPAGSAALPLTEAPTGTATAVVVQLPPTSTPRPSATVTQPGPPPPGPAGLAGPTFDLPNFGRAFVWGIGWTAGIFALIGLYAALRPRVRPHLWRLMRRLARPR
jgi:hypothetical protein